MSWLQQLVVKLKSVGRRKGAEGEPTTAAGTSVKAGSPEAAEKAAPVTTVLTEDVPDDVTPEAAAEKPAPAEETVAVEPAAATEAKPATASDIAEPAASDSAAASEEAAAEEPAVTESVVDAKPEAEAEPAEVEPAAAVAEPEPAEESAVPDSVVDAEPEHAAAEESSVAGAAEAVLDAEAVPVEAANPAINTLDDDGRTAELIAEGPYGPGSGKPTADGSAPSADFTVKAKASSKLFHTQKSPYFTRTKADVWFKSEADAESAGFQAWDHKKRAAAKK